MGGKKSKLDNKNANDDLDDPVLPYRTTFKLYNINELNELSKVPSIYFLTSSYFHL